MWTSTARTRAADAGHVGPVPGRLKEDTMTTLEILRTGPLALVEDLGRTGMAHLGVTRSGRPIAAPHPGQPAGGQHRRPRHRGGDVGGLTARVWAATSISR